MGLFDRIRRESTPGTNPEPDAGGDALRPDELVPQGGTWSGVLVDNPSIGLSPALTWTFELSFADVSRDYGDSPVSLTVEWVPLPGASWSAMTGLAAASDTFADPIECSAYFFEHHRYDFVRVRVLEQVRSRLRVEVEARGDVDGLGVPAWSVETWLDFDGIYVQLSDVETAELASSRLAEFTDCVGLVGTDNRYNFKFVGRRD
jgi:hypothetical protein